MGEIGHNGHLPVHILVVEDSAVQAEALRRILAKEGYTVSVAKNGIEGLSITREKRPDLVITDIMMPEMNGFELCGHIKTEEKFKATPVILLTSLNDPKDVINGLKCGADNFITKPFDEKYLLSRIKYMLLSKELHISDRTQMGVEIYFAGEKHLITSERQQILDILLSTYETAVQKNFELVKAQENLKRLNEQLEEKVKERTIALEAEVAERKRAQKRLQHLNMVLFAIRKVNQLITQESNCNRLLQGACERMVSTRGYDSAWIVLLDESKKVVSYAEAGIGEDFLPLEEQLKYSKLPICSRKALTQSGSVITQDTTASCTDCPLAHWHTPRGELTSRVEHGGHIYGLVTVSGPTGRVTDKEEIELFEEVTADIALGLSNIKREEQRKKVEEALRKSEERFRLAAESATDLIYEWDMKERVDWFGKIDELLGYAPNEFPRTLEAWTNSVHPDDRDRVMAAVKNHLEKNEPYNIEYRIRRKDGAYNYWWVRGTAVRDEKDNPYRWIGTVSDVTERKRTEEALIASEERYRTLFEGAAEGIVVADIESHRFKYVNPAICRMLGYTMEELTQLGVADVHPKEALDYVVAEFEAQARGEKILSSEIPCLRKDSSIVYVNIATAPVVIDGRRHNVGFFIDVTERKKAEEHMRLQSAALEAAANAIIITDREGMIEWANPAFTALTGYSFTEVIRKNPRELVKSGEQDQAFYKDLWDTILAGRVWRGQIINRRKDGSLYTEEMTITPLSNEQGEISRFIAIKQDITERKRAEGALKESEERYRTAIENSNDGVAIDKDGLHLFVNKNFLELFGYDDAEEVIGKGLILTVHPDDRDRVKGINLRRLRGENVPSRYEFKGIRKDGKVIYIEVSGTKTSYRGEAVTLTYLRDITERKRAEEALRQTEEQLRQSQKMEAIGRLAGGIAHDFNNLLTVIKGYSQLSLLEMKQDNHSSRNIEEVLKASDQAAGLTRQLLAFSRRQIMEMRVLDLDTLLQNMDKMLRRVIGEDIELVTILTQDLGMVKTDTGQIEQVILNLAVNAKDAMPNGGKLTIETANVELDEEYARNHADVTPGHYVMLSVSDTGVGMIPEVKERIFEPFFTTKETEKGTGLGLSTVYGIVKQSDGNIWVYSEPGKGTAFKIYLPRVDEPLEEISVGREVKKELPRGNETILVVEDEEEVRKLALHILKNQGYKVLEASQGVEAFLVCEQHEGPIHLLLTDVVMPKMSGHELADRIIQILPEIKVLYMSGYTDNAIVHHGILDKRMNYIQKPFAVEGLARKVREVLDQ